MKKFAATAMTAFMFASTSAQAYELPKNENAHIWYESLEGLKNFSGPLGTYVSIHCRNSDTRMISVWEKPDDYALTMDKRWTDEELKTEPQTGSYYRYFYIDRNGNAKDLNKSTARRSFFEALAKGTSDIKRTHERPDEETIRALARETCNLLL